MATDRAAKLFPTAGDAYRYCKKHGLEAACRAFLARSHGLAVRVPIELLEQGRAPASAAK